MKQSMLPGAQGEIFDILKNHLQRDMNIWFQIYKIIKEVKYTSHSCRKENSETVVSTSPVTSAFLSIVQTSLNSEKWNK